MASNLNVGVQQYGTIESARGIGGVESITQDPLSPREAGEDALGSKYTTTASSGNPIPDQGD